MSSTTYALLATVAGVVGNLGPLRTVRAGVGVVVRFQPGGARGYRPAGHRPVKPQSIHRKRRTLTIQVFVLTMSFVPHSRPPMPHSPSNYISHLSLYLPMPMPPARSLHSEHNTPPIHAQYIIASHTCCRCVESMTRICGLNRVVVGACITRLPSHVNPASGSPVITAVTVRTRLPGLSRNVNALPGQSRCVYTPTQCDGDVWATPRIRRSVYLGCA